MAYGVRGEGGDKDNIDVSADSLARVVVVLWNPGLPFESTWNQAYYYFVTDVVVFHNNEQWRTTKLLKFIRT